MQDKRWLVYGPLTFTDYGYGFMSSKDGVFTFDYEAWGKYCAAIANAGANAIRVLPYGVWGERAEDRKSQFSPYVLEGEKWNLDKWNPEYFKIMRKALEIAVKYRLTVWFCWFDNCQLQPGTWTIYSPWKHNTQGIASFYDKTADKYCAAWVKKVVAEFGDLDIFWPWGNELNGDKTPEWARRVLFPLIKSLKIPYDKMTYGAVMDDAVYLGEGKFKDKSTGQDIVRKFFGEDFPPESNKFKLLREVHKCGTVKYDACTPFGKRPEQAAFWWGNKPVGDFVLSDDGTKENWPSSDGGRPDADRWGEMMSRYLRFKNAHFEHLPEGGDLEHQIDVFKSMSEAYKAKHSKYPDNYGKVVYEPSEPEPTPEPTPDPVPAPQPVNKTNWALIGAIIGGILAILALVLL